MKVVTIVGARPQFVKAAVLSRQFNSEPLINEVMVHTGQHYDSAMSDVFFKELDIPKPSYHLNIGGKSHGVATGEMLIELEGVFFKEKPDVVVVYGDTNSTLAGALAAAKLHIPIAHVEAGLRSFNMKMPEEQNRRITDHLSSLLFCPSSVGRDNLRNEGIINGVSVVGDIMFEAVKLFAHVGHESTIQKLSSDKSKLRVLLTVHRAENVDDVQRLESLLHAVARVAAQADVLFPIHPRTKNAIDSNGLQSYLVGVHCTLPLPYIEMLGLLKGMDIVMTDSGGLQKEAYFLGVPCLTLRDETEWVETVEVGANSLVGTDSDVIYNEFSRVKTVQSWPEVYGAGNTSSLIVKQLLDF